MNTQQSRRDFLRQSLSVGTGLVCCCANLSCRSKSKQRPSRASNVAQTEMIHEDFSELSYCCIRCDEQCEIFAATKNNDQQSKARIASRWSEKFGKAFKSQDVACYGCKAENMPVSYYATLCSLRKCARDRRVITCAHCDDFPSCQKDSWTKWPSLREKTDQIRNRIQTRNKT